MVNSHHTPLNRERIISTQQTSGKPVDIRRALNNQVFVALSLIKNGKAMRKPEMVKRGEAMKAEAAEQLRLLNAIDNGKIVPIVEGGTIALNYGEQS